MYMDENIYVAMAGDKRLYLNPAMANRHGLIAGATGTGKTVTMKVMAESFSDMGVPVFMADVKGDVSGLAEPGENNEGMQKRIRRFGLESIFRYTSYPVAFWDIYGQKGIPVRVTISDMGPVLLGRLLDLTEVQCGVLHIAFRVADDNGLLLIDLKDLRSMLTYLSEHRSELVTKYGNVTPQSVGAIQRALLKLEDMGGDQFFGEPSLEIKDWMRRDEQGRGYINLLNATKLVNSPLLYSTFLLWMMTELFNILPEVGDPEKPTMVFFFDEAHLLFNDAPKAFLEKVVQVVKLIRSKGVGIYFISQSPADIPNAVLSQLSNRVQHALRAYTPAEAKAVRVAASTFRANPAFKAEEAIMNLGTGEALVSFLDKEGIPAMVENAGILPPQSLMAPCMDTTREKAIRNDPLSCKYKEPVDRYSAYEKLTEEQKTEEDEAPKSTKKVKEIKIEKKEKKQESVVGKYVKKSAERVTNSILSTFGREIGRAITRSIFGTRK